MIPDTTLSFSLKLRRGEGFFSMDTTKPYKRHVHIVEGLDDDDSKNVHVSDVLSTQVEDGDSEEL